MSLCCSNTSVATLQICFCYFSLPYLRYSVLIPSKPGDFLLLIDFRLVFTSVRVIASFNLLGSPSKASTASSGVLKSFSFVSVLLLFSCSFFLDRRLHLFGFWC